MSQLGVKRVKTIQLRVTAQERKAWKAQAHKDGMKLSEWIRAAVRTSPVGEPNGRR